MLHVFTFIIDILYIFIR